MSVNVPEIFIVSMNEHLVYLPYFFLVLTFGFIFVWQSCPVVENEPMLRLLTMQHNLISEISVCYADSVGDSNTVELQWQSK